MNNFQPISETSQLSLKLTVRSRLIFRQTAVKFTAGCHSDDFLKTNLNFLSFWVNKLAPVSFWTANCVISKFSYYRRWLPGTELEIFCYFKRKHFFTLIENISLIGVLEVISSERDKGQSTKQTESKSLWMLSLKIFWNILKYFLQ